MYSNSDDSSASDSPLMEMKSRRRFCAICGAKSAGLNFDVLTCSSCKAFFRRNGVKPLHQFLCRSNGQCQIDERSRRQCTACRLRKCFTMGMVKERIRTEEQNQRHRALVEENRRQKLTKYQQQANENRSRIYEGHRHQASCSTSASCLSLNRHCNGMDLIFDLFLKTTEELIPQDFLFEFDADLTDVLNSYCVPIASLITFFKQISHFQQLPIDDRLLLLKTNVKILLPILTHLLNTTLGVEILINHPGLRNINTKISYAYSLFASIIPDDNKLLTLIIIVFLFCPSLLTSSSLHDAGYINDHSRQLIRSAYDEYTVFLWFYTLNKSGDDEQQATLIYMKMVTKFLHLQNVMSEIYDIVNHSVQMDRLHMMMQSILHLT